MIIDLTNSETYQTFLMKQNKPIYEKKCVGEVFKLLEISKNYLLQKNVQLKKQKKN